MRIQLDRESAQPIYLQIRDQIRAQIAAGELPAGFRLPPERDLAARLGVNRTTVLGAYRELKVEGLVEARVGRGTSVVARGAAPGGAAAPVVAVESAGTVGAPLVWGPWRGGEALREADPLLRNLLEQSERHDLIPLAIGMPAPELLPLAALRDVCEVIVREPGPAALLHGPTEGLTPLREALAAYVAGRGIRCGAPELLVTSGSQQGLDLVARAFLEPGDAVIVEEPSYFGALQTFRGAQARLVGVPCDRDGMRVDLLEGLLTRVRPKLIYTLPTFQNPSGAVMSLARRERLLELAGRHEVPVLEDDVYADLRYEGEALPSLKALDRHGGVLHLGSFSKVLFPGLRLGFLAGPVTALRRLALVKQHADLHTSTFAQWILLRFLADGHYAAHLATVRAAYRARRDTMDTVLRAEAPPFMSWHRPEGGFYHWCVFSEPVPLASLLARAGEEGVTFLPGTPCFAEEPAPECIRLNFSHPSPDQIREGVGRLMRAVRVVHAAAAPAPTRARGTRPIV